MLWNVLMASYCQRLWLGAGDDSFPCSVESPFEAGFLCFASGFHSAFCKQSNLIAGEITDAVFGPSWFLCGSVSAFEAGG